MPITISWSRLIMHKFFNAITKSINSFFLLIGVLFCFSAFSQTSIQSGWNLVGNSTNVAIAPSSIGSSSSVNTIWKWNSSTNKWAFYSPTLADGGASYATGKGYETLTSINSGEGFWINATHSFTLNQPSGSAYSSSNFSFAGSSALLAGWNLISTGDTITPSSFNTKLGSYLNTAGFPINITTLWAWNNTSNNWVFYSPQLESQGNAALADYISNKKYEDFTATNIKLQSGIGFWVNNPLTSTTNLLPSRLQWNANNGYCGEVSFISAGLHFGQYISQYDARALASPGVAQNLASSQLLLGVNDASAAKKMHLKSTSWNNSGSASGASSFLVWVKTNVVAGYPVIIGLYNNEALLYNDPNPSAGNSEYDHIVLVTGAGSYTSLSDSTNYYASDLIQFSDHGLWTGSNGNPSYIFKSTLGAIQATRQQANVPTAPIYSLSSNNKNYGIAITGILDDNNDTVPVRLTTSQNYESPEIVEQSDARPAPSSITLTVTVSNLKPGVAYNLYRYNSMASVPNSAFNKNASQAIQYWPINISSGTTYQRTDTIKSNEVSVYRAVPASAE